MRALALLASGFVAGLLFCILPESVASQPKPSEEWRPTKVHCRGNGAGGYRQCGVHVYGKVDKVTYDLWINGEYHTGLIYEPFGEGLAGLKQVK